MRRGLCVVNSLDVAKNKAVQDRYHGDCHGYYGIYEMFVGGVYDLIWPMWELDQGVEKEEKEVLET